MSLFSWFSKKATSNPDHPAHSPGLEPELSTAPLMSSTGLQARAAGQPVDASGGRKTERTERLEQIYSVVRDAMTRAGILSASYKFKVLSLDPRGRQYLIMMDLSNQLAGDTDRLAEIEALIAQSAKSRHDILVAAVYWRVSANVTAGLSSARPNSFGAASRPMPLAARQPAPVVAVQPSRYEPLQADEVMAFKNALATATAATVLVASGEVVKSGRRNPALQPDFENTELRDHAEKASPLSATQYGDLN